jgi:hypothetical protein
MAAGEHAMTPFFEFALILVVSGALLILLLAVLLVAKR